MSKTEKPIHLEPKRIHAMSTVLRQCQDPSAPTTEKRALNIRAVHAVFEPDSRGLTEVLFRNTDDEHLTAWMRGKVLAFITEGW